MNNAIANDAVHAAATHTPGPWAYGVNGTGLYHQFQITTADGQTNIADIRINGHNQTHGIANARLIAAAPELLEALQETLSLLDGCLRNAERLRQREVAAMIGTMISVNRAAIAQATGGEAKQGQPNILGIRQRLAEHGILADFWTIGDVQSGRPDLTDEQCWDVLEAARDSGQGITQETLRIVADNLFSEEDRP